ncbi:NBR1-Ig-like domain-containing protein [Kutzneria sp. NPDC052558]|uniref:NBR1-Ig-like domain-containing protein n=1 Tax=Kutzneria sp. NPDC052558 TaxID=3364121 RepID=UPI0037C66F3A
MGPEVTVGATGSFAHQLWRLKKAAGDPSYDRMRAEFGALASKSALSEAARGHRLPSWDVTWEFVRPLAVGVLGQDPASARRTWRLRWETAAAQPDRPVAAIPGDRATFVSDLDVPDGTVVPAGGRIVKTWALRNSGTVPWIGRYLRRAAAFGPDECVTPAEAPIPATRPGEAVRVSVDVRLPETPGYHQVYWKMVDSTGRLMLPGQRAVFFLLQVV